MCTGGALLVAEMLLDEGGTSPPEVLLQSLNMLTQTHGRERRLSEYCHMLEAAGFRNIQGKKTGAQVGGLFATCMGVLVCLPSRQGVFDDVWG